MDQAELIYRDLANILTKFPRRFHAAPNELTPIATSFSGAGFSGAKIVRVRTQAGDFCLRGWPPDSLPRARILGLHRLLDHIYSTGQTQVAVPVVSTLGATLVTAHGRQWQLEPWMPGTADFHTRSTNERLRAAMHCLANWHQAAVTFRPKPEHGNWFGCCQSDTSPAVLERLELLQHWNNNRCRQLRDKMQQSEADEFRDIGENILQIFERLRDPVSARLKMAASLEFFLQPCLRDIWHDHVLFTGDEVTGVIDASACRTENVATDLSRLLGSLVGDNPTSFAAGLDEYAKLHPLSLDELGLVHILDQSGVLLSSMVWLERRYLDGVVFESPARINERLRTFQARLQTFANET